MKHDPAQPFDSAQFADHMAKDDTLRSLLIAGAITATAVTVFLPGLGVVSGFIAPAVMVGLWLWLSTTTARAARTINASTPLMRTDPAQAEAMIDQSLRYRPVMRWVRLLAYHRLAGLRHQQRRFTESAAISLCLLNQRLKGPSAAVRPNLLLMLAEAQMELGNLPGAYHALAHLHQTRLSLSQALQRLAIQTRYELAVGAYEAALNRSRSKVQLAELMPVVHCAAMHAMLATAAHQRGHEKLAGWLWERTRLLAPPGLIEQLERGGFGVCMVEHEHADAAP